MVQWQAFPQDSLTPLLSWPVKHWDDRPDLPTMYDLPSEDPEEIKLSDEFHPAQAFLLSLTCISPVCALANIFMGEDLNIYYDPEHTDWHKRPDWFLAVGVEEQDQSREMKDSYVVWNEQVSPFIIVELLSPSTMKEDLGVFFDKPRAILEGTQQLELPSLPNDFTNGKSNAWNSEDEESKPKPPSKWEVYETILQVPYYIVHNRRNGLVRAFHLTGDRYVEIPLNPQNPRVWIPELELGLGLWQGTFKRVQRSWLRWYDRKSDWVPTPEERERLAKERERSAKEQERLAKERERLAKERERSAKEQERLAKEQALQEVEHLRTRLMALGIDPDHLDQV